MRYITLTSGDKVLVSRKDYKRVSRFSWCVLKSKDHNIKYARRIFYDGGVKKHVFMHRFILGLQDPEIWTDHKNLDGLDNRRSNLRICTRSQNLQNTPLRANNTSGFKGVSWNIERGMWRARIRNIKDYIFLGYFRSKVSAARAYDKSAKKLFGRFARLNF